MPHAFDLTEIDHLLSTTKAVRSRLDLELTLHRSCSTGWTRTANCAPDPSKSKE